METAEVLRSISDRSSDFEKELLLKRETANIFEAVKIAQENGEKKNGIVLDALAAIENTHHFPFEYSDISVPVEVFHGDADDMVPLDLARAMCSALPCCNLTVKEAGTHALLMDVEIVQNVFQQIHNQMKMI
eukprot:CAMPEP_0117822990 /NCGR_PEP_ID=MMETSP0949-20121206/4007_1 /TAXON_ID=44440 /ORGANISM="Chattonella subsalsa, Strain CCMP2191" /LENGTH=131 /DNA_ID=CAMNT_0005662471 /DNA_START=492 /DNA_END=887 /DNA_ORIENTATION=-